MRRGRGSTVAAVLAGVSACLAACGYTTTVRNDSSKTVVAEIKHDRFLAPNSFRGTAQLAPGDSVTLGPYKVDPLEPMHLRIRIVGDLFGAILEERLEPGTHAFVIENGTLESWEAVQIRRDADADAARGK
jgi:hypothetical protein